MLFYDARQHIYIQIINRFGQLFRELPILLKYEKYLRY